MYEVDGVRPADLFKEALAAAEVNVDTIIQMDSRIVFSAPSRPAPSPEEALAALGAGFDEQHGLGKVSVVGAGMSNQVSPPALSRSATRHRAEVRRHLADQNRVLRASGIRRGDRASPPRGLRPQLPTSAERQHDS